VQRLERVGSNNAPHQLGFAGQMKDPESVHSGRGMSSISGKER